jgi:uncharacterized membrane protein
MTCRNLHSLLGALALYAWSFAAPAQPPIAYRLELIGTQLQNDQSPQLVVSDLNDKGEVVGSRPDSSGAFNNAFIWRDGVFEELPLPGSGASSAGAINDKSDIVGSYEDEQFQTHSVLLRRGNVVVPIEPAAPEAQAFARDLNNRRQVLVAVRPDPFARDPLYFIWQRGAFVRELEPLPGSQSTTATEINDRGAAVGTATAPASASSTAVIWEHGTIMEITSPTGVVFASGADINNHSTVLGNALLPDHSQAFIWKDGETRLLPLLPGTTWSDTNAINNRGAIVGRSFTDFTARDMVATIWRRGRPSNLNTQVAADDPARPFVHLQWGLLINDRGQIVAQGRDSRSTNPDEVGFYLLTPQR